MYKKEDHDEIKAQLMEMFRWCAKEWKRGNDMQNKREAMCAILEAMTELEQAEAKHEMVEQVKRAIDGVENGTIQIGNTVRKKQIKDL